MSALTKVFVVLHVVLSILLASALIVFVNRTEDWRSANSRNATALSVEKDKNTSLTSQLNVAVANKEETRRQLQEQLTASRDLLNAANQQIISLQGEKTTKDSQIASAESANRTAQAALQVAQSNQGKLQTQLIATRTTSDDTQTKLTEANVEISNLSNRLQVLQRQVRNLNEELAAAKDDAEKAPPAGSTGQGASSSDMPALPPQPAVASLNGIVRATQSIGGIKYATISIGSAETVKKGMQFRILGGPQNQQFMGYVTVTSVEPHESVGRVEGPRVTEVAAQNIIVAKL